MEIPRKTIGKKGFISDPVVDIWAIIIFVIVIIVFALIYKNSATEKMEILQDKRDVTYGNYIAQVYLQKPIKIGDEKMTMAELISFYDYNQSIEAKNSPGILNKVGTFLKGNLMEEFLGEETDMFVKNNMDSEGCYVFAIKGNSFEKGHVGTKCEAVTDSFINKVVEHVALAIPTPLSPFLYSFSDEITFYFALEPYLKKIPKETYVTYIAPIDPRSKPIELHVIYDLERLLSVYSTDADFKKIDVKRMAEEEKAKQDAAKEAAKYAK